MSNSIKVASVLTNTPLETDGTMNQASINEYATKQRQRTIADTAQEMATNGKSKQEVVGYLEGENFPQPAVAADVLFAQVVAIDEAKKKARNTAFGTILFGVALAVFGFIAMSSGTNATDGGRRSPLGALLIGLAMVVNGLVSLRKIHHGDL